MNGEAQWGGEEQQGGENNGGMFVYKCPPAREIGKGIKGETWLQKQGFRWVDNSQKG